MKPYLILYYYPRRENESFQSAEKKAEKFANSEKFSLILFVTREPNHSGGTFVDRVGHYFKGMRMRTSKKIINSRTWWGPKDLVAHLCQPKYDLKKRIGSSGRSPIALIDISPKCILDKQRKKWDLRKQLTDPELRDHFERMLSYKKVWKRIKLVIFSVEASITDGRKEHYREARELFQGMIDERYGKKDYLSVPFFG